MSPANVRFTIAGLHNFPFVFPETLAGDAVHLRKLGFRWKSTLRRRLQNGSTMELWRCPVRSLLMGAS